MKKQIVFYAAFFGVLAIGFFLVIAWLLPGFAAKRLPVISYVQPFAFTDQEGETITNKDVNGKVYVAEYFFTTCKGICPKMNTNMKKIYDQYKGEKDFLILSHTVDPETDSVGRMKRYADSLGVTADKWLFLTGTKDSLYHIARQSYVLDDPKNNNKDIAEQFIHTQFFALVDREGQVRKIYDGLEKDELALLSEDIQRVLEEKPLKGPFQ